MYVSPFTEMASSYHFELTQPGPELCLAINLHSGGEPVLATRFKGGRQALTDRALLATFISYPLMALKVIAGIYFEALRLWIKGVPLVAHVAVPDKISSSHPTLSHMNAMRDSRIAARKGGSS